MDNDKDLDQTSHTSSASGLRGSTSETAIQAAQGALNQAPDVKQRVEEAAKRARRNSQQVSQQSNVEPSKTAANATMNYARAGYRAASEQVVSSPLASLTIAAVVGIAVGWMLRGAREEERQRTLVDQLPDYVRRRMS